MRLFERDSERGVVIVLESIGWEGCMSVKGAGRLLEARRFALFIIKFLQRRHFTNLKVLGFHRATGPNYCLHFFPSS
jgi:hypothetical protein